MPPPAPRSTLLVSSQDEKRAGTLSPILAPLRFSLLVGLLLALAGCAARGGQGSDIPTVSQPTGMANMAEVESTSTVAPPAPTAPLPPAATLTAMSALTVVPVPTEIPGLPATHVARATASPFPTSLPAVAQVGPPSVATSSRDAISIELRMAGDTYMAGENGRAEITVLNASPETLFVGDVELAVTDEEGKVVDPWPVMPGPRGGWPGQDRFNSFMRPVEPGQSISKTITFQMPPLEQSRTHTYKAKAMARFSRGDIQHPDRSDNVAIPIETVMPWPLQVVQPIAEQRLNARWQANRQGYSLRVTDAKGQPVSGPVWGAIEVSSGRASMSGPLPESVEGTWSSGWDEFLSQDGTPLQVRAWVAARGYVPATIEETIPGTVKSSGATTSPGLYTYTPVPTVEPDLPVPRAATIAPETPIP